MVDSSMRTDADTETREAGNGELSLERADRLESVGVPADVESARAKLVYLSVAVWGELTPDDLCDRLSLRKGTVLSIANSLRERGYLERRDERYAVVRSE